MKNLLIMAVVVLMLAGCKAPKDTARDKTVDQFLTELKALKADTERDHFTRPAKCANGVCSLKQSAYLPQGLRVDNYRSRGQGSCYHAATAMAFNNANMPDWAADWTSRYGGAESASGLHTKLDRAGIDYVATTEGDVAVLDYAHRTNRIAPITFKKDHVCVFIRWEQDELGRIWAVIVDPNYKEVEEVLEAQYFIRKWRSHGGAATVVLAPVNPPSIEQ